MSYYRLNPNILTMDLPDNAQEVPNYEKPAVDHRDVPADNVQGIVLADLDVDVVIAHGALPRAEIRNPVPGKPSVVDHRHGVYAFSATERDTAELLKLISNGRRGRRMAGLVWFEEPNDAIGSTETPAAQISTTSRQTRPIDMTDEVPPESPRLVEQSSRETLSKKLRRQPVGTRSFPREAVRTHARKPTARSRRRELRQDAKAQTDEAREILVDQESIQE
ncbi:hypothetical protein K4K58_002107 [Colletotrichum sp. SAR11_239]|nr:hypothetical protein K4K58_002107 [Colletotrichum sp. SAR11_239]